MQTPLAFWQGVLAGVGGAVVGIAVGVRSELGRQQMGYIALEQVKVLIPPAFQY